MRMQWMRWVMRIRQRFGAQHLGAGKSATSLYARISAPNQVDGFALNGAQTSET
jgi:hypothetical protein